VVLDSATGIIAQQGHIKAVNATGQLTYTADTAAAGTVVYNTLATPKARQYRLTLPDGTKVWLNAASSICYPIAFTGKERRVTITGEVYMEVAKDAGHPFIVTTRHSDITVLGTHFNIMAYEDEPAVNTTLLEGSVKISIPGKQTAAIIKPGEQASVDNGGDAIKVKQVNAKSVAAWINGFLSLKDCSVQEFMNQLSRWYDISIEYAGEAPQQRFGGMINRNTSLSDILSVLDTGGIHTKLEGKKIVVLPY
jgi:ferric-dicitrate binding protein FerR (iron transport regulator)